MKKAHYIYLALVIVLGLLAYIVWSQKGTTLSGRDTDFRLLNPEQINGIELSHNGHTISLYKLQNKWMIDNEEANQDKVKALLLAASQMEMAAPVSVSASDSIIKAVEQGITVRFFEEENLVKAYTLNAWNSQYYAQLKKSNTPYRIKVSGYGTIDLLRLFNTDKNEWLSNLLINYTAQNLQRVQVAYPQKPEESFGLIKNSEGKFMLFDYAGNELDKNANQSVIQDYLHFFTGIRYAEFAGAENTSDKRQPLFQMLIQAGSKEKFILAGYPLINIDTGDPDPFIFLGEHPDLGVIKLNYSDFDPILVPLDYFLKK